MVSPSCSPTQKLQQELLVRCHLYLLYQTLNLGPCRQSSQVKNRFHFTFLDVVFPGFTCRNVWIVSDFLSCMGANQMLMELSRRQNHTLSEWIICSSCRGATQKDSPFHQWYFSVVFWQTKSIRVATKYLRKETWSVPSRSPCLLLFLL